jgi:hypothetical protein
LPIIVCGCGNESPDVELLDVSGSVYFEGQPMVGALIVFHPLDAGAVTTRPRGYVLDDGSFRLTTFSRNDGIPAGRYAVTVTLRQGDDDDLRTTWLPAHYMAPETSGLSAEIIPGRHQLAPFHLKR